MRHVMVDIETLGSVPGSVILSIGAVTFDCNQLNPGRFHPWVGNHFFRSIDIFSSLLAGLTIDPATAQWWKKQSSAAQYAAQPIDGKVSITDALGDFHTYLTTDKDTYVWAKGPDFDLTLLQAAYQLLGNSPLPWKYRNARDVRTIYWLAGGIKEPNTGTEHSAIDDAEAQARGVISAMEKIQVTK